MTTACPPSTFAPARRLPTRKDPARRTRRHHRDVQMDESRCSNGLTEEIVKKAKGTTSDNSFHANWKLDGQGQSTSGWTNSSYISFEDNTTRRQKAFKIAYQCKHGQARWDTGDGWNESGYRTFSAWVKANNTAAEFAMHVKCTDGTRLALLYRNTTGSPFVSGSVNGYFPVGGTSQEFLNKWTRLERDIQADITTLWPGKTLSIVTGTVPWCGSGTTPYIWFDDLKLSNSVTKEHNVLGPGVIAHIMRHRTVDAVTFAASDGWFHYDQVGSVCMETNISGDIDSQLCLDAAGLPQLNWNDLLPSVVLGIAGQTTRRDISGLNYSYQRWHHVETGLFMSSSPVPPLAEHSYSYGERNPVSLVDPTGMMYEPYVIGAYAPSSGRDLAGILEGPDGCYSPIAIQSWSKDLAQWVNEWNANGGKGGGTSGRANAMRHCMWQCLLRKHCRSTIASSVGAYHEKHHYYPWKRQSAKDLDDHSADMHNNKVGRRLGKNCEPLDCFSGCATALDAPAWSKNRLWRTR